MITTSNLPPIASENLGVIDLVGCIHAVGRADKVEIKVGSITKFAIWAERELGALRRTDKPSPSTFAGVPVVEDCIVPGNMAFVVVNGEIEAIVNFDEVAR
jgi:hypothetical protein